MNIPQSDAWNAALAILKKLRNAGHRTLFAGGCVRDVLLGRTPKDYDVATDALPDEVLTLFPHARQVGAKFGVMLVSKNGFDVEVATFRTDGAYSDGRHPDEVQFTSEQDDARRRDFTVNGMFMDPIEQRVLDYVGGQDDLQRRIIKTIGEPDARFGEDHLRMLRAVRFAATLSFDVDSTTMQAIVRLAGQLQRISPERIWQEVDQILRCPSRATGWALLQKTGLATYVSPRWLGDVDQIARSGKRLFELPDILVSSALGASAVTCERSRIEIEALGVALRWSNDLIAGVSWLATGIRQLHAPGELELADLKTLMAQSGWCDLLTLFSADLVAHDQPPDTAHQLRQRADAIAPEAVAPPPWVTGDDLIAMGAEPGPKLGLVLEEIRRAQLNEEIGSREQAVDIAQRKIATD